MSKPRNIADPVLTGAKQGRDGRGRFNRGTSGNPKGRPAGTRNQATRLAESLLHGNAEKLIGKAIELALNGNVVALRMCVERLLPPVRELPLQLDLPLQRPVDAKKAMDVLVGAVADGQLSASELGALSSFVSAYIQRCEDWEKARTAERFDEIFPGLAP